ncbi:LacI family transcriptional regulator [Sphingobium algorifonticola]|uniref:LacI family transcriptional regulator n=2 Tax=Sphingobium algorifonticola TaxID=2008318 RepID=A0A437JAB6_9SPHN|nr:LacI family transcriptional regulator [Sphingobium algorifonticola]
MAGVSPGTVSRALADSPLISAKTRERIQAIAREHDFRPNAVARNLRTQRTGAIGVVIPLGHETGQHISDPFFMTMLGLLADSLTERGYDLLLSRIIPSDPQWLSRMASSGRVDGLIIIGQSDQAATLDAVAARYRPLVVWGGHVEGQVHCSVGSDNRLGGEIATAHLIARGARRIAFFGDPRAREIAQRLEGCRAAMAAAGLSHALQLFPTHLVADTSHADIVRFLGEQGKDGIDGIVAASDVIASSALRAMVSLSLHAPDDIRVIGYDDLPIARQTLPRLSTIRQELTAGADALVDLLFRRIGGEDCASFVMPPKLIVRHST